MSRIKIGDIVTITDGSYAVRLDKYESFTCIGLCKDKFEVIHLNSLNYMVVVNSGHVHDIHIKNIRNGNIYLHTSRYVQKASRTKQVPKLLDLPKLMKEIIDRGYKPLPSGDWCLPGKHRIPSYVIVMAGKIVSYEYIRKLPVWIYNVVDVEY